MRPTIDDAEQLRPRTFRPNLLMWVGGIGIAYVTIVVLESSGAIPYVLHKPSYFPIDQLGTWLACALIALPSGLFVFAGRHMYLRVDASEVSIRQMFGQCSFLWSDIDRIALEQPNRRGGTVLKIYAGGQDGVCVQPPSGSAVRYLMDYAKQHAPRVEIVGRDALDRRGNWW